MYAHALKADTVIGKVIRLQVCLWIQLLGQAAAQHLTEHTLVAQ